MRLEDVRTDPVRESEGSWMTWRGYFRFKVARSNSDAFDKARNEYLEPHKQQLRFGVLPEHIWNAAVRRAYAKTVLVDWDPTTTLDHEYKPTPYSWQAAEKYLSDPGLHDLYNWLVLVSANADNFRREEVAKDLGNSPSFSTGSENGDPSRSSSSSTSATDSESRPSKTDQNSTSASSESGTPSGTASIPTAA